MLRLAFRALAIALYTLVGAAMIVDARREGGLPEGFPFLAELRETRERFAVLGGAPVPSPPPAGPRGLAGGPRPPAFGAGPTPVVPGNGTVGPDLPAGPAAVRVNRGLP